MPYELSYFCIPLPINSESSGAVKFATPEYNLKPSEVVNFLITQFDKAGISLSIHERYEGCDIDNFEMITLTAKYGILKKSINIFCNHKVPSDSRNFARLRIDTSNNLIHQGIEKVTSDLDGWIGKNSKQFYLPSTGRKIFLYLNGEQSRESISKSQAIENIVSLKTNYLKTDELDCLEFEEISELHLIHVGIQIGFDNSHAYIPLSTEK